MGLSHTVSEIDCDFSWKSQNFPTPLYFAPALKDSLMSWVSALRIEKLEWWGYWADKEVWRYLQQSGYNTPWWIDRWTDTGWQQNHAYTYHKGTMQDRGSCKNFVRLAVLAEVCGHRMLLAEIAFKSTIVFLLRISHHAMHAEYDIVLTFLSAQCWYCV